MMNSLTRRRYSLLPPLLHALLLVLLCAFFVAPAAAQTPAPPTEKLTELMRLMDDPAIRKWIESQRTADKKVASPVVKADDLDLLEGRARLKFHNAAVGLPILTSEYAAAAGRVQEEARSHGILPASIILGLILLSAIVVEWVIRRFALHARRSDGLVNAITSELVAAGTFAIVVVALFFVTDWPPMVRAVLRSYLVAAIIFRLAIALGKIMLAGDAATPAMFRRLLVFSGVFLLVLATGLLTVPLAINPNATQALSFIAAIVLMLICVEAVWRQPAESLSTRIRIFQSVALLAIFVVWAMGFHLICWIGLFALFLPKILASMEHLARAFTIACWPEGGANSLKGVLIVYGVRTLVIAAAIAWLAYVWSSNPYNNAVAGSFTYSIASGLFRSLAVLLVADFSWRVFKALIEKKLASVSGDAAVSTEEAARRARIRTLLPIFRNGLAVVVLMVTVLTVLAEMGVEIGPLIAGAGIFGVAIGFGSQTLVKDVISGVFYLMDDAFRVGEYIQSGSYMGTVESFSLRSVRLRHHRGPIFTVPFGELGAVQNMSRDWVIDKFRLRVTFDADINKAKKLTKAVGAELLADPELGPLIIETVKMKGVEQINEYGVELGFAFSAKPGNQAMVRRRAYAMIRQTFSENGINFAQPTVQVGGDDKSEAAAAALRLAEQKKQAAAAEAGGEAK